MDAGSAGPHTSSPRLLQGGRIFALVALGGGLLICLKAFQPWVAGWFATDRGVGISGPSREGPIAASIPVGKLILALGIAVVIGEALFIFLSSDRARIVIATGVALASLAIWALIETLDLSSLAPTISGTQLPECDHELTRLPCVAFGGFTGSADLVRPGVWGATVFGVLALVRARSSRVPQTSQVSRGTEATPHPSEPSPVPASSAGSTRRRGWSDLRIFKVILITVTAVLGIPIVLLVGAFFLASRESPPSLRLTCPESMEVGTYVQLRAGGEQQVTHIDWEVEPLGSANFGTEQKERRENVGTDGRTGTIFLYAVRPGTIQGHGGRPLRESVRRHQPGHGPMLDPITIGVTRSSGTRRCTDEGILMTRPTAPDTVPIGQRPLGGDERTRTADPLLAKQPSLSAVLGGIFAGRKPSVEAKLSAVTEA